MRIVMLTGKGGTGKTSVAAATALRSARLGRTALVVSTDPAHSLADVLTCPLGDKPVEVAERLWAQEVDVHAEIERHWSTARNYFRSLFASQGVSDIVAEEMAIFPGMEELFSLLAVKHHVDEDAFDIVVVDCAPTGATLRLLSLPDVLRWYMRRLFHIERSAMRVMRPVLQRVVDMPIPEDEIYASMQDLYHQVDDAKDILSRPDRSSVRLVTNPERMAIEETKRAFTYLCLYGFPVDALVLNRTIPPAVQDPYFDGWKRLQRKYRQEIADAFSPLPILEAPLFDREIVGLPALERMGEALYGDSDPGALTAPEVPMRFEQGQDGAYLLKLALPFARKADLEVVQRGRELALTAGGQRRNVLLPHALARMRCARVKLEQGWLVAVFEPKRAP